MAESPLKWLECSSEKSDAKYIWLRHAHLEADVKIRFESRNRNHKKVLADLIRNYMPECNKVNTAKFVFGMVHLLKIRGMLGKKIRDERGGIIGKQAFVLMLLTWLVSNQILPNAQLECKNKDKTKEKKGLDLPPPKVKHLRSEKDFELQ